MTVGTCLVLFPCDALKKKTAERGSCSCGAKERYDALKKHDTRKHVTLGKQTHVRLDALKRLIAGLDDRAAADPVRVGGELGGNLKVLTGLVVPGVLPDKLLVTTTSAGRRAQDANIRRSGFFSISTSRRGVGRERSERDGSSKGKRSG